MWAQYRGVGRFAGGAGTGRLTANQLQSEWCVAIAGKGVGASAVVQKKVDAAAKVHVVLEPNGLPNGYDVFMSKDPMPAEAVPPIGKDSLFRYRAMVRHESKAKTTKVMFVLTSEGFSIVEGETETLYKIKAIVKYLFKPEKRLFRFVTKHNDESIQTICFFSSGALVEHLETTIAAMIQALLADTGILSTVLFDFESEDEDELNVKRGDRIAVLEVFDDGWLLGSLGDGTTGMIPVSHVYSDAKVIQNARRKAERKLKRMTAAS